MNSPDEIKKYVDKRFSRLGVNKKREITRLLYEISKRDGVPFHDIAAGLEECSFLKIKKKLLEKRFPMAASVREKINPYLPGLSICPEHRMYIDEPELYPENIYFDKASSGSGILDNLKKQFPDSMFTEIISLKEYVKAHQFSVKTYNLRRKNFFVVKEGFDFFKKCPCTKGCVCCGYYIFNLGFGCPYECTYCYLQEYTNIPGIIIPSNLEEYFEAFKKTGKDFMRIGTGEFADSLALDNITGFSSEIIDFFRKYPKIIFEFKTKSSNVENIIKTKPAENVVIAWSLNPQSFIDRNEFYSAALSERIEAAKKCADAGYKIAFHFDPVVCYEEWKKEYKEVVDLIFDSINGENIKWISLGTFRFHRNLKKIIENRFPENRILDGELIIGFDGKLRYTDRIRIEIYKNMINWITNRSPRSFIYLCMESKRVWKECGISPGWRWR